MLRLFGALIVIIGCGLGGMVVAKSYALRPQHLRELSNALQLLATEIDYARTSLSEACSKIAGQTKGPAAQFFAQFAAYLEGRSGMSANEAWSKSLQVLADAGFVKQELKTIGHFGSVLGRSDAEDQLKHLALLQTRLEQFGDQAEQEREKMVRLWNYLGFCIGALAVLMLI